MDGWMDENGGGNKRESRRKYYKLSLSFFRIHASFHYSNAYCVKVVVGVLPECSIPSFSIDKNEYICHFQEIV